jgi:alpha-beta hydrolase superfamily lysophospholipase
VIRLLTVLTFVFVLRPVVAYAEVRALPILVEAYDGAELHAAYYPAPTLNAPAVLLLHQLYTNGASWTPTVAALRTAGYAVLVPDLRGHGLSRADINWPSARQDTLQWLDWMREQPFIDDTRIAIVGSSMGANLAVVGCAEDNVAYPESGCVTAVALSPGLNYYGYTPLDEALAEGLQSREVLFISSERDAYPARAVRQLPEEFEQISVIWLEGNAHGMDLFTANPTLIDDVILWLDGHLQDNDAD